MWGDWKFGSVDLGGDDTFVFPDDFGTDFIGDFRQGEDRIEFDAVGFGSFGDLDIDEVGSDTIITSAVDLAIMDSVTVVGVTGMTMDDFMFV